MKRKTTAMIDALNCAAVELVWLASAHREDDSLNRLHMAAVMTANILESMKDIGERYVSEDCAETVESLLADCRAALRRYDFA